MKNKYYFECELPININRKPLDELMDSYKEKNVYSGPIPIHKDYYDKGLIDFLKPFNIIITHACIFYTPPNYKKIIHIDESKFDDHCKLNWVYGPSGFMRWWEPIDDKYLTKKYTKIGTDYISIDEEHCRMQYEVKPKGSHLVNVGALHSVENDEPVERWCLSHVLYDLTDKRLLHIDKAVTLFSNFLK
jgi:hypothetical protein